MKSFSSAILVILLALGLVAATGVPAWATLIAYEGYEASDVLKALNGSTGSTHCTGFSAAWVAVATYKLESVSLPLPINNLGTEDGAARMLASSGNNQASRRLVDTLYVDVAKTWYFSGEISPSGTLTPLLTSYANFGLSSTTTGTKRIVVGYTWIGAPVSGYQLDLTVDGGTRQLIGKWTDLDPRFYVVKAVTHGDGTVDAYAWIYKNTDILPISEPAWDAHTTATGLSGVTYPYALLAARSYNSSGNPIKYDEYRLGTTWNDVVSIPEPSTLALLGMGLVGLLCYAWRKRK